KISTFVLELDSDSLPLARANLPLGLAVGVTSLYGLDEIAQFSRDHPEKKHDALLVDGFVPQTAKIERVSISRDSIQLIVGALRHHYVRRLLAISRWWWSLRWIPRFSY